MISSGLYLNYSLLDSFDKASHDHRHDHRRFGNGTHGVTDALVDVNS